MVRVRHDAIVTHASSENRKANLTIEVQVVRLLRRIFAGISIALSGLSHFLGALTQGSQGLALGLPLIAAPQLRCVVTSGVRL